MEKPTANVDQVYDDNAEPTTIITKTFFRSDATPVLNSSEIVQKVSEARHKIMESLEQFFSRTKVQAGSLNVVLH